MDRRRFLTVVAGATGATVLGAPFWRSQYAHAAVVTGPGPYGPLVGADANGISVPAGFSSRVIARSGQGVGGTGYIWHGAPDGGACFASPGGGWTYVSNSELSSGAGGASAVRFAADGSIAAAYRVLGLTTRNCAGGPTPWGSWLSCEENGSIGNVWECDPQVGGQGVRRAAMGAFNHEAAAVHPTTGHVYLTEDDPGGRLYRFVPASPGNLAAGQLQAARVVSGDVTWLNTSSTQPDRSSQTTAFNGGEGAWIHDGVLFFTTKGDDRVWELNLGTQRIAILYQRSAVAGAPLGGVDNITAHLPSGDLYICEDGGNMEMCMIAFVDGVQTVSPFLRVSGQSSSEIAGAAFDPTNSRLYFSSQRGTSGSSAAGITYEVVGPFRTSVTPPTTTTTTTSTTTIPPTTSTSTTSTTTTVQPSGIELLVPFGALWRYLDNGSNQATAWRSRTFSDSGWKSGPAPLGYGDPMATTVGYGPSASRKYVTTYFRTSFVPSRRFTSLALRLRRDDGCVVYINGTEVARSNMPSGSISSSTLASSNVSGSAETQIHTWTIQPPLVAGPNVMAIEVHQRSRDSSDLRIDAELTGNGNAGALPPP
jgi:uncharacterized protein